MVKGGNGVSIRMWGNSIIAVEDDQGNMVLIEHPTDATEFKTSLVFNSSKYMLPDKCTTGSRGVDVADNHLVVQTCGGLMTILSHHQA